MRIRSRLGQSGYLGYCANVHPGETLDDVLRAISHFGRGVREELAVPALSLGLWLGQQSLAQAQGERRHELRRALDAAGVFVVTLNGFPYGNFHAEVVKRQVYHPDLGSPERRKYLHELASLLTELLPTDAPEGTISTLPVGHRSEPCDVALAAFEDARWAAARQLCGLCEDLARLRDTTGKSVRICLEPEPGCWLESTDDALAFFTEVLPVVARREGVSAELLRQHLGVCYDTCHQAIAFEDAAASISRLAQAGIRIGKAQLSSALEIEQPADPEQRAELLRFAEPRFLHQVRTRTRDGALVGVDDLDQAARLPEAQPWRVHFHVPIHRARFGRIGTTRAFLEAALQQLAAVGPLPHLEIETYTWGVLPEGERPRGDRELMLGIAREVSFVVGELGGGRA
jgi:sugar phosphate isomerase/epimerase